MSDKEVQCKICSWIMGLDTDFFCSGMDNLAKCWGKCHSIYSDYVEK
jgi:hypothetical protein